LDINNLAEEDIDEQEITVNLTSNGRLIDDELLSFVNVYFPNEIMAHEAYHVRHTTNPEQNRNGNTAILSFFMMGFILLLLLLSYYQCRIAHCMGREFANW